MLKKLPTSQSFESGFELAAYRADLKLRALATLVEYLSGRSTTDLAKEAGLSQGRVMQILHKGVRLCVTHASIPSFEPVEGGQRFRLVALRVIRQHADEWARAAIHAAAHIEREAARSKN